MNHTELLIHNLHIAIADIVFKGFPFKQILKLRTIPVAELQNIRSVEKFRNLKLNNNSERKQIISELKEIRQKLIEKLTRSLDNFIKEEEKCLKNDENLLDSKEKDKTNDLVKYSIKTQEDLDKYEWVYDGKEIKILGPATPDPVTYRMNDSLIPKI